MRARLSIVRSALPLVCAGTLLLCAACGSESATPDAPALSEPSLLQQDTTVGASLAQVLRRRERFRLFSTLLDSAGLLATLRRDGPYTVFATTDPRLDQMPDGLVEELLLPANRERLRQVVAYHLHRGRLSKDTLRRLDTISTLTGQSVPVAVEGQRVLIGGNRVSEFAVTASNGRLFAFDALAMPPIGGPPAELPEAAPSPANAPPGDSLDSYDTVGNDGRQGADGTSDFGGEGTAGDTAASGDSESGPGNGGP